LLFGLDKLITISSEEPGCLNRCKGHADLIAAIDLLRKLGFNVELQIAGEDEQGGSGYG
jgi:hypothetical protein